MKDLFLILIVLAAFAFGYYIMRKVDHFIEENQRLIATEHRNGQCKVRIGAENTMLLDSVASALESCSNAVPHIEFFLSSGKKNRLLEKLLAEQLDIVLLTDDCTEQPGREYASLFIPYVKPVISARYLDLPIEDLNEDSWIHVVWKKGVKSKNRDRVIFALENDPCGLKCGNTNDRD